MTGRRAQSVRLVIGGNEWRRRREKKRTYQRIEQKGERLSEKYYWRKRYTLLGKRDGNGRIL